MLVTAVDFEQVCRVILVDVYDWRIVGGVGSIVLLYRCRGETSLLEIYKLVVCATKKRNGTRKDIWNDSVSSLWGEEPINGDVDAMQPGYVPASFVINRIEMVVTLA